MKLPRPFPHFVSSLLCTREQGFDAVRTLFGQRGKGQFCNFCGHLLWTAPLRGVFRGGHCARIAKLHKKVSKIEAWPSPFASWASGFGLEITWYWAKNGTKFEWRPFFLLFTWFWAKNGTKFECDIFKFWSMFLSNFLKFLAPHFSNSCLRYWPLMNLRNYTL